MMETDPTYMVDMEKSLKEDKDGSFRDQLVRQFDDELAALKRQVDRGLPPDEFEQATRLQQALTEARSVVEILWNSEHGARRVM